MRNHSTPFSEAVTEPTQWHAAPPELALSTDMVHLWRAGLDQNTARLRRLERNLSTDERARAARFRFTQDRERFVAARGLLREILSLYLDVEAGKLSFGYGTNGKPFLAAYGALRFNVSHSLDTVLIAVAYKREIGVDIEHVHDYVPVEEIANTVFSTPERHALSRIDSEARRMAFLQFWTRKEAYIKADGRGVSLPLEHIDVSAPTNSVAALDKATGEWRVLTDWRLQTLAVSPDYAISLAVEDQGWELVCWRW